MWWLYLAAPVAAQATPLQRALAIVAGSDGIDPEYWNSLTFIERLKVYNWNRELLIISTFVVYLAVHFWGVRSNYNRVQTWMEAVEPVLDQQFAQVGCTPEMKIVKDSASRYTTYATGRTNIATFLARFHTVDRQNIVLNTLGFIFPALRSIDGLHDNVEVTITPHDSNAIEPQIFAVVSKFGMQKYREKNFYLSLTRTTDSDLLPPTLVFMSEHRDITERVFQGSLKEAVLAAEHLIEYFAVTDQGVDAPLEPKDLTSRPKIRFSVKYPRKDADKKALADLITAIIGSVDALVAGKPLRADTAKKIKNTREEQVKRLERDAELAKKEERDMQKAQERREAARKANQLSEKEQRKQNKKQQEREARKMRAKQTRRV